MRREAKAGLRVLRRVRDYLSANEVTTALGPVTKQVEGLSVLIDRLSSAAVEQDDTARAYSAGTRTAQMLSRALRNAFMRPVSRLGKTLFPNDEALQRALKMPPGRDYEGLIAAAQAMANRAAEHKERFVAAGFGEDFVERVRQAAEELRKVLDAREVQFSKRSAASAGLRDAMARGRDVVRLLDDMLSHAWEGVPDRLAQWATLSRFVRSSASEDVEDAVTPGSTPAVPVPVPATPVPVGVNPSTPPDVRPINTPFNSPVAAPVAGGDVTIKVA